MRICVHTQSNGTLVHSFRVHEGRTIRVIGEPPRYSQPPSLTPATWILHWAQAETHHEPLNP